MTRMDKYKALRTQIAKDIRENTKIWEQEQKLDNYRQQLIKIDKSYFEPVFKKLTDNLNLINFENYFVKNNDYYLKTNDKLLLESMLKNINTTLSQYTNSITAQEEKLPSVTIDLEYQTLINGMHNKISEFQKNLESKISDVENFIKNLEFKYKKHKLSTNEFEKYLNEIQTQHHNYHDRLHKIKPKPNYKISLVVFSGVIICLVLLVVLILLVMLIKN